MPEQHVVRAEAVFGLEEAQRGHDVDDVVRVLGGAEFGAGRRRRRRRGRLRVGGVAGEAVGEGDVACYFGGGWMSRGGRG